MTVFSDMNSNTDTVEAANSFLSVIDATSTPSPDEQQWSVASSSCIALSVDCVTYEDPGLWPVMSDATRVNIVRQGAVQATQNTFPYDADGRKFSSKFYTRQLVNGDKVPRLWLVYSQHRNAVFCFCCKVFPTKNPTAMTEGGCADWKIWEK